MEEQKTDHIDKFRRLDFIFILLLASQIIFAVTSLFLVSNKFISALEELEEAFKMFIMVFTLTSILILRYYYSTTLKKLKLKNTIEEKLDGYYSLSINRMASVEGINLFSLIAFLLTGVYIFLIVYAIILALFLIYRPTRNSFILELKITGEEKEYFRSSG